MHLTRTQIFAGVAVLLIVLIIVYIYRSGAPSWWSTSAATTSGVTSTGGSSGGAAVNNCRTGVSVIPAGIAACTVGPAGAVAKWANAAIDPTSPAGMAMGPTTSGASKSAASCQQWCGAAGAAKCQGWNWVGANGPTPSKCTATKLVPTSLTYAGGASSGARVLGK